MDILLILTYTWYLSVIPSLIYAFLTRRHLLNMKWVSQKLQGRIDSEGDLYLVKKVINQNIAIACVLLLIIMILIGEIYYLIDVKGAPQQIFYHLYLFLGVVGLYHFRVSKGQKRMQKLQSAPPYETPYAQYLKIWLSWRIRFLK